MDDGIKDNVDIEHDAVNHEFETGLTLGISPFQIQTPLFSQKVKVSVPQQRLVRTECDLAHGLYSLEGCSHLKGRVSYECDTRVLHERNGMGRIEFILQTRSAGRPQQCVLECPDHRSSLCHKHCAVECRSIMCSITCGAMVLPLRIDHIYTDFLGNRQFAFLPHISAPNANRRLSYCIVPERWDAPLGRVC